GYTQNIVTQEEIEQVYRYKTARYTFSLPLMLGALLAQKDATIIQQLENFGEKIGTLFQLKDDDISLFGKEETTGKPEGSDIRENKKTLHRHYLFQYASSEEKQQLQTLFGKQNLTKNDIAYVRELFNTLHIEQ